jgi:hypothetical protein
MNYKWWVDHPGSAGIYKTSGAPDNVHVFSTFTGARNALTARLQEIARQASEDVRRVRQFRRKDRDDFEISL